MDETGCKNSDSGSTTFAAKGRYRLYYLQWFSTRIEQKKNSKDVPINSNSGYVSKGQTTLVISVTAAGELLPIQMIFDGKTLPKFKFRDQTTKNMIAQGKQIKFIRQRSLPMWNMHTHQAIGVLLHRWFFGLTKYFFLGVSENGARWNALRIKYYISSTEWFARVPFLFFILFR